MFKFEEYNNSEFTMKKELFRNWLESQKGSGRFLYYHSIVEESIVDGPGIRNTLFVQGCNHNCKGCHNPETHEFNIGNVCKTFEDFEALADKLLENPLIDGITISGGDPLYQILSLKTLIEIIRFKKPDTHLMIYTGFTMEEMSNFQKLFLCNFDIIVDGPFIEEQKSFELAFRGSANQRIWKTTETRDGFMDVTKEWDERRIG